MFKEHIPKINAKNLEKNTIYRNMRITGKASNRNFDSVMLINCDATQATFDNCLPPKMGDYSHTNSDGEVVYKPSDRKPQLDNCRSTIFKIGEESYTPEGIWPASAIKTDAVYRFIKFKGQVLNRKKLGRVKFYNCDLSEVEFSECNMKMVYFEECQLGYMNNESEPTTIRCPGVEDSMNVNQIIPGHTYTKIKFHGKARRYKGTSSCTFNECDFTEVEFERVSLGRAKYFKCKLTEQMINLGAFNEFEIICKI